jgi:hypothetical protein
VEIFLKSVWHQHYDPDLVLNSWTRLLFVVEKSTGRRQEGSTFAVPLAGFVP